MDLLLGMLFFTSIWFLLNCIVYYSSGLYRLRKKYSINRYMPNEAIKFHGFAFGSFMIFGITEEYLYIKVHFPFSLSRNFIVIPMSEINIVGDQKSILTKNLILFKSTNLKRLLPSVVVEKIAKIRV